MKIDTIGFIGGGRITRIILQAFENRSLRFNSAVVYDPDHEVLENLQKKFPFIISSDLTECAKQDLVILAVHPPAMMETLTSIREIINKESVILSLAPKFNINKISEVLATHKIIRMIPNATSYINKGYNPVYFDESFGKEEKRKFLEIFSMLGETFEVEEYKLEGYAIVSAMLPTYFWFQWEKIEGIALETGLSEKDAIESIEHTLLYSIYLFYRSELNHEEVIDLIPVKPIGDHESEIREIYETRLMGLYEKIRSTPAVEMH